MRVARLVTTPLAALAAGVMLVSLAASTAPAGAVVPSETPGTASSATSAASQRAVTDVHVGAKIRKSDGKLVMVGNVTPPKGPLYISKATHCNRATGKCNFEKYKKVHVRKGRYESRVEAPEKGTWFWQARVGPHKSAIWQTCKTTGTSCG